MNYFVWSRLESCILLHNRIVNCLMHIAKLIHYRNRSLTWVWLKGRLKIKAIASESMMLVNRNLNILHPMKRGFITSSTFRIPLCIWINRREYFKPRKFHFRNSTSREEIFAGRKFREFREFWPNLRKQIPFLTPENVDSWKLIPAKFVRIGNLRKLTPLKFFEN